MLKLSNMYKMLAGPVGLWMFDEVTVDTTRQSCRSHAFMSLATNLDDFLV